MITRITIFLACTNTFSLPFVAIKISISDHPANVQPAINTPSALLSSRKASVRAVIPAAVLRPPISGTKSVFVESAKGMPKNLATEMEVSAWYGELKSKRACRRLFSRGWRLSSEDVRGIGFRYPTAPPTVNTPPTMLAAAGKRDCEHPCCIF